MERIIPKYTGFVFGEGKSDKKFLINLIELPKFKFHTKKWEPFHYGNYCGCSPEDILTACKKSIAGISYDLVICFIDLDQLKKNYPNNWASKKLQLEKKYRQISIVWQEDNLEEEIKKVLGDLKLGKRGLNKLANQEIDRFINSSLWKKILACIKAKEAELEKII